MVFRSGRLRARFCSLGERAAPGIDRETAAKAVSALESVEDIMRRVIERKKAWYPRLKSLRCEAFARITVEKDTGVVFMMEGL